MSKDFNRLSFINSIKEMIGLKLYFTNGNYFYAWGADHAYRKVGFCELFIVNDYGEKIKCGRPDDEKSMIGG